MITSPQNERVKLVRLLQHQAKSRRQHKRLVLEGVRLIRDALDTGIRPDYILYTLDVVKQVGPARDLIRRLELEQVSCLQVADELMRDMSDTETPQGVLGVFPWPSLPIPESPDLILVADGWRDPGNLGTLLRTAAAAGVPLIALAPGTVDVFNPKTIRASMGAIYRVPVRSFDWPDLTSKFADHAFYLADAQGEVMYDAVDWTQPSVIVVGGEAHGFGQAALHMLHTTIRIPMMAGAESLNAAVASSLLVYAARRHAF